MYLQLAKCVVSASLSPLLARWSWVSVVTKVMDVGEVEVTCRPSVKRILDEDQPGPLQSEEGKLISAAHLLI
jgi:hypothetical protein